MIKPRNIVKGYNQVNNPAHYVRIWWIEPIDFITSNNIPFAEWCIIKYIFRYKNKNWLEDLEKAKFFLERVIKDFKKKEINKSIDKV